MGGRVCVVGGDQVVVTYISDFYDEIESERIAERGNDSYVRIATAGDGNETQYVRNQRTGVLLAITKTSMTAVGGMKGHGDPLLGSTS